MKSIAVGTTNQTLYWVDVDPLETTGIVRYAPLSGGAAMTLAEAQPNATSVVTDTTSVYYTLSHNAIGEVPLAGGPGIAQGACTAILCTTTYGAGVGNQYVYWLNNRALAPYGFSVVWMDKTKFFSSTDEVSVQIPGLTQPSNIRLAAGDDSYAYWAVDVPTADGPAGIYRGKEKTHTLLAAALTDPTDYVRDLKVVGGDVYWSDRLGVHAVPVAGGSQIDYKASDVALGIAVDDTHVYWTTPKAIERAPIDGGPTEMVVDNGEGYNEAPIAIDANRVYWSTQLFRPPQSEDLRTMYSFPK